MEDNNDPFDQPLNLPEEATPPTHQSYPLQPKHSSGKKPIFIALTVLILAGLAYGSFKLLHKKSPPAPVATTPAVAVTKTEVKDLSDATSTKEYENGFLGLALTHPSTWTTTETTDNGVRIESPTFSYENLAGNTVSGYFRIYIRKGARAIDSKYIGRGVAIQPSEKLTYTKPAVGQRADTLLSLFGLDTKDNFAYFFVAGNFQLKEGDTLGPNYGKEPETFIVAGGYSTKELKDDLATTQVPTSYIKTSNAFKQAIDIIKSLQLH